MAPTLKTAPTVRVRPRQTGEEAVAETTRGRRLMSVCSPLGAAVSDDGALPWSVRRWPPASCARRATVYAAVSSMACAECCRPRPCVTLRDWRAGETPVAAPAERRLLSVDVPTADPRIVAALDAVPLDTRRFDEWDLQVLTLAGTAGRCAAGG